MALALSRCDFHGPPVAIERRFRGAPPEGKRDGITVRHILSDGSVVDQAAIDERLMELSRRTDADLFASREQQVAEAYRERASKVAYAENKSGFREPVAVEQRA